MGVGNGGTITIETITITRPMKVIAFTCCVITVIVLLTSCSTSDWVMSDGWREGLFVQCVSDAAPLPLPFGGTSEPGCRRAHSAGYIRGTAALVILALFTDFFGTLLMGLGLRSTDPNKKYKYYRVSIYSLTAAFVFLMMALIIYPVSFSKDMDKVPKYNGLSHMEGNDLDFDNDGILNILDTDDDNDGIPDEQDEDDDDDGIPDDEDNDDDNDGIDDANEVGLVDFDNDGILDHEDDDDDNDGIADENDDDDDGDGIPDDIDTDDDNDGILDEEDMGSTKIILDEDRVGTTRIFEFGFGYGASWASAIFLFCSVILLICDRESEEIFYKERQNESSENDEENEEA